MNITVLIRVYDRIEDLRCNLRIIRDTWSQNNYYIIVVSNGKSKGYNIDAEMIPYIDKLIILDHNEGHIRGNAQLLREGSKFIPQNSDCTLILEADTWSYGDDIVNKYANIIINSDVVWASADWYDKYVALATDFAIIKSNFIKDNPLLFDFGHFPECYIANYLRDIGAKHIWIEENMPVHVPSYVLKYPYVHNHERRFYIFPNAKMVTHHVEFLKNGIAQKKYYFNIVANCNYFPDQAVKNRKKEQLSIRFWIRLSHFFLKRSWYHQKYYKSLSVRDESANQNY